MIVPRNEASVFVLLIYSFSYIDMRLKNPTNSDFEPIQRVVMSVSLLQAQVFCIGNPVVWWAGTLAVVAYCGLALLYLLRRRRAVFDLSKGEVQAFTVILSSIF